LAQSTENFTVSKGQAPTLEVRAGSHSSVHVRGWDRPDYAVEVCKLAAAESRADADRALRSIAITRAGGRFSVSGPDPDDRWRAIFFVHAPKDAALNLESGNAPIDASGVNGKLTIRANN